MTVALVGLTVNVAVSLSLPPGPVHVNVYEYNAGSAREPVLTAEPVVGCAPPHEPDATQLVAFAVVQLSCAD